VYFKPKSMELIACLFKSENNKTTQNQTNNNAKELTYAS
jgi:hypothetical protein